MLEPKYIITDQLLLNIKKINNLISYLNGKRFPNVVLAYLERNAREISTFASTRIEGNPHSLTEVRRILKNKPENLKESEKEIVNYNKALIDLNSRLNKKQLKLSIDLVLEIQKKITNGLIPSYQCGTIRTEPVVVREPFTGKIVYIPPDEQDVPQLFKELVDFVIANQTKIDPLILAAIFHKQMVIIHPFADGNGRSTRLATKTILALLGINTFNLFSFEVFYNNNVTKYFMNVGEYGDYYELKDKINFTPWIEYFAEGILDELLRVEKVLPTTSLNPQNELRPFELKMLNYIEKNGYINDAEYAKLTKRAKATRTLDFKKLIKLGILKKKGLGKATYYILSEE